VRCVVRDFFEAGAWGGARCKKFGKSVLGAVFGAEKGQSHIIDSHSFSFSLSMSFNKITKCLTTSPENQEKYLFLC
jgi:hypothetical protein